MKSADFPLVILTALLALSWSPHARGADNPQARDAPTVRNEPPEYIAEFERIGQHRHRAIDAAGEALLRQYCHDLEPLLRRAEEANDQDALRRMRTELETSKQK